MKLLSFFLCISVPSAFYLVFLNTSKFAKRFCLKFFKFRNIAAASRGQKETSVSKPIKNKKGRAQALHGLLDNDKTSHIRHFTCICYTGKRNISMRTYQEWVLCLGNPWEMRFHQLTAIRVSCLISQKNAGGKYIALSYLCVSNTWW